MINSSTSTSTINSNLSQPLSLSQLADQKLELTDFIGCLASCKLENIRTFEELAKTINAFSLTCSEAYASINRNLVMNLILKQFPDPFLDGIRELIKNADDSNIRRGDRTSGVHILLEDDAIIIKDCGDGIGLSNLQKFFVPGCSTNKTLSDINEGLKNVTGRFGQGLFAAFSYLFPQNSLHKIQKLEFIEDNGAIKLVITCEIDGIPHEVTSISQRAEHGLTFETSYAPLSPPVKRKISIHSWREGDEAIKIKFTEVKGLILLDIAIKPKKEKGTTFKICSPLIKTNESSIKPHINKVFKSVSSPITLNGVQINDSSAKKINFNGGYLSFTPLEEKDNFQGLLRVCESECLILDYPLQDFLVPKEVTINFDRLVLSQERASIDFKNSQTILEMESLIETIVKEGSLCSLERSALLNALCPIIESKRFNLTKKICDAVIAADKIIPTLSVQKELQVDKEEKCQYLNHLYFSPTDQPHFFEGKNYKLYLHTATLENPIMVLKKDDEYHVFINEQFCLPEVPSEFEYNLHLLNLWLKNKDYPFSIEVSEVIARKCSLTAVSKEIEKEGTEIDKERVISQAPSLDWESYENVPKSEIENASDMHYLIEFSSKYFYPRDEVLQRGYRGYMAQQLAQQLSFNNRESFTREYFLKKTSQDDIDFFLENQIEKDLLLIRTFWGTSKSNKHLKYFCDILSSQDRAFSHFNKLSDPLFFKFLGNLFESNISVRVLHNFLYQIYLTYEKKSENEKIDYLMYLSSCSWDDSYDCTWNEISDSSIIKITELFHDNFKDILSIFNSCNFTSRLSKQKIFKTWSKGAFSLSKLKDNFQAFNNIALRLANSSASKYFISCIPKLIHLNFFESLSQKELEDFFKALATGEKFFHIGMSMDDYKNILWLSQKSELNGQIISKWVEIYCICSNVISYVFVGGVTGILRQLINSYLNVKALDNLEDLEVITEKMQTFLINSRKGAEILKMPRAFLRDLEDKNRLKMSEMTIENRTQYLINELLEKKLYVIIDGLTERETVELQVECYVIYVSKESSSYAEYGEFFRKFWERLGYISAPIRPFIYALFKKENLINNNFVWPIEWREENAFLLHQDKDVIELLGSEEVARCRLLNVVAQTTEENMFVKEFCKNSQEAGATEIKFEVLSNKNSDTVVSVRDNGKGMDLEGLKVFKTPNYSTKSQSGNFGQGALTGLSHCDEMIVTTSKDGINVFQLALKKTPNGIEYQQENLDIPHPIGTTILLKKEKGQPLVDLVKLEAELVSSCQYFRGIEISFQNVPINKGSKLIVLHEEKEEDICVQLGKGEEGIYCNNMRMSSLGNEYTAFLPDGVKEMLSDNKIRLRVFIPHTNQVMNRNFLVKEDCFLEKIQALIFSASINYYVKQWIEGEVKNTEEKGTKESEEKENNFLNIVSADYWNNFGFHNTPPDDELLCTIEAIQKRNWSLFAKKDNYKQKKQLVEHTLSFFNQLKESHELTFNNKDSSKGIEEMLSTAIIKEEELLRNQWLESLKAKFVEPSAFVSLLVHYPLNANGLTFMKIRSLLTKFLFEEKIVGFSGSYNFSYIESLNELELSEVIKSCVEKVVNKFGDDSKKILAKMSASLVARGKGIIGQKNVKLPENESWQEKALEPFFVNIGGKLGKKLDIEFYTSLDGRMAYTNSLFKSKIFVNRKEHLASFVTLCTDEVLSGKITSKFIELVANMVDTIAHEIVHLNEDQDCKSTHDKRFHDELSKLLNKLFICKESMQQSPLELLKELFPKDTNKDEFESSNVRK